jgi:transcriptional regulator with XRE-family HTH domain
MKPKKTVPAICLLVGNNIRLQRLARNYNQEYVAQRLEICTSAYGNIERGAAEVTLCRICAIATVLEVEIGKLLQQNILENLNPPPRKYRYFLSIRCIFFKKSHQSM